MKLELIAVYLGVLVLIYLMGRSFFAPVRWIFSAVIRGALGAGALLLINIIGAWVHWTVPVNPYTALFAGFLGIPGVVALLIMVGIR